MALGLKTMIQISGRIQLQPQLGGITDFSTVMIPVLNGPRAENHDTNFRENPIKVLEHRISSLSPLFSRSPIVLFILVIGTERYASEVA